MADYYVDNSGADGDGSIGTPWNNIAGHINSLSAADMMHVRGDSPGTRTYTEAEIVITVSGTDGSPITMQPYSGENVNIEADASNHEIFTVTGDWIDVVGFEMDRNDESDEAVQISGDDCNLFNCHLHNCAESRMIFLTGNRNTVEECIVHETDAGAYQDAHGVVIRGNGINGNRVIKSTIYDCRGDCVQVNDADGVVGGTIIEDNELYTTLAGASENGVDAKEGNATHQTIVRRNVMHGFRYCDGSTGGSGGGIGAAAIFHNSAENVLVEDNVVYDCDSGIVAREGVDIIIRRNLFYDFNDVDNPGRPETVIRVQSATTEVDIYNNTFVECPRHLFYFDDGIIELRNNLCFETHTIYDNAGADADYNGWFNVVDSIVGAHDTTGSDPQFRDEAGDDYHIRRGSSAVNAGIDVGLDYIGSAPDLGYKEHRRVIIVGAWS